MEIWRIISSIIVSGAVHQFESFDRFPFYCSTFHFHSALLEVYSARRRTIYTLVSRYSIYKNGILTTLLFANFRSIFVSDMCPIPPTFLSALERCFLLWRRLLTVLLIVTWARYIFSKVSPNSVYAQEKKFLPFLD